MGSYKTKTYAEPKTLSFICMHTRKGGLVAGKLKYPPTICMLAHPVLEHVKLCRDEFQHSTAVIAELPPSGDEHYDGNVLRLVSRLNLNRLSIYIIVKKSLYKSTPKATWMQRWNQREDAPFKFYQ